MRLMCSMAPMMKAVVVCLVAIFASLTLGTKPYTQNSTYYNPILPGFHPDPSCIFVKEWDDTFFCVSSSFNAFPGIPLHASKDLRNWKLIGHVLNRREQLPRLAETNRSTSGIWAPTLRFHDETFWLVTTLVDDDRATDDASRWDNIIFQSNNPFDPPSWSEAIHFDLEGYDTSPVWDSNGKTYIVGAHSWKVFPGILLAEANLETGEVGEWNVIWNGTGGTAPEGPHIYLKDGWYYLLAAEGGTGLEHMVTMARSKSIHGPYEANSANPVLTNSNTTNYFQTVGHADLFQDSTGNWWGVALSTRSGPEYINYPMGRETVMVPVMWADGEFPVWSPLNGEMSGWEFPETNLEVDGPGPIITEGDTIDFEPESTLPAHFTHWRFPIPESYTISPPDHPNTLKLNPSKLNLTALNGNYAGPDGQTFVGRRQQDTLFTYSVDLDFAPTSLEEEAGVSVFLTQNHHLDLGVVLLPANASTASFGNTDLPTNSSELIPQLRFRGISYVPVPDDVIVPIPEAWSDKRLRLEIKAHNMTHYSMSAGPADALSQMRTILDVSNAPVSWGFSGVILGIYCTSNGYEGNTPAYFSKWRYIPQGQFRN
ncbi:glycoside hydrolase family 43 protein [Annulohypoxylon maeteangense]|uniref:glycoside hydrolase family 43 protein n=1 Tax=Annulohypoxylon maeteangense TaxID=1927788 RepID=UPI002008B200|nr:glycoside hydrolase family 43 protein [Annulohypoxylon maeteangense]KAI0888296.1 glycoside hydrolase family 43 protein [Annulohypoxylon maeteangense]